MKFYKLVTHSLFRKSRKFNYIITYIGRYILSLSPVAYGVPQGSVDRTDPFYARRLGVERISYSDVAGWVAGWLGGCLSQPVLYQND